MPRTFDPSPFTRRGALATLAGAAALPLLGRVAAAGSGTMQVYKSPTCGCCARWVDYARAAGWRVEVTDMRDIVTIKKQVGLPPQLAACHTTLVGGYVVEGHVPLPAVDKLLAERPPVHGIAVPGMPQDSPGMGGGGVQEVLAFTRDGTTRLFMRTAG